MSEQKAQIARRTEATVASGNEDMGIPLAVPEKPPQTSRRSTAASNNPKSHSSATPPDAIPSWLAAIAKWERRLLWWGLLAPLAPLLVAAVIGVPMQALNAEVGESVVLAGVMITAIAFWPATIVYFIFTHHLAKAMGKPAVAWAVASAVPYAGMLAALALNMQATSTLKAAGLKAAIFGRWRRVS